MFVSAGADLKFHSFPVETSDFSYTPQHTSTIKSASWSKDNCFLTFVSENARPEIISLKDLDNIRNVHTISAVNGAAAVAFQRTTKKFIGIATNAGQVALYDTKNKAINKLFETAPCPLNLLDFNTNDKQMAASCVNGSILLYETSKTNVQDIYNVSSNSHATTMRFHPSVPSLIALGTEDGTVMQWDIDIGQNIFLAQIHSGTVSGLVLMENSKQLATVGIDHKFCIHDVNSGESIFRSNLPHPLTAVDVSANNLTIAVGNVLGNIYVYDTRQLLIPRNVIKSHSTKVNKILFEHKVIDEFDGNLSAVHSTCCIDANEDTKRVKQQAFNNTKNSNNTMVPGAAKCTLENVAKGKKEHQTEPIIGKSIKEEVAGSIYKSAEDLRVHIMQQIGSLQKVIANEFHILEDQMEEKWDLLNRTLTSSKEGHNTDSME